MKDVTHEEHITTRRNQILDAAAKVFAAKGFHPTTIKDIAKEAGIADGTIYNYFDNKPALLIGILDRMKTTVLETTDLSQLIDADLRTLIKAYLYHPMQALKADNFALFRVIVSETMVNQEMRSLYYQQILDPTLTLGEGVLQQWAEKNAIKSLDISLTLRTISAVMLGLMLQYVMGDITLEEKWDELPDFLADLFLDGIGVDHS